MTTCLPASLFPTKGTHNSLKVAYISGPYAAPTIRKTVEHIRAAECAAIQFWRRGYAVLCPHTNSALLDGVVDYEVFIEADLEFVRRSDLVVMLPRWRDSAGATREHALAQQLGKEIVYL